MPYFQAQEKYVMPLASLFFKMNPPMCCEGVCFLTSTSNQYFSHSSAGGLKRRDILGLFSRRGSLGIKNFPLAIETLTSKPCGCKNHCYLMNRELLSSLRQVLLA